jgi:starch phosphorylase
MLQVGHYLPRDLPEPLQGLATLALDLRWSWHDASGGQVWRYAAPPGATTERRMRKWN